MYVSIGASKRNTSKNASTRTENTWLQQLYSCKNTWAKTLEDGDELQFIFGNIDIDSVNKEKFGSLCSHVEGLDVFYPIPDTYQKGIYKFLLSMRDFLSTDHSHFIKGHTGSYYHLGLMKKMVNELPTQKLYAGTGSLGCYYGQVFCSGACSVMSRDVVEEIWKNHRVILDWMENPETSWFPEDVMFGGLVINILGISPIELPRIYFLDESSIDVNDKSTAHYYVSHECGKWNKFYEMIHNHFGLKV
jgi:hypothetical protein